METHALTTMFDCGNIRRLAEAQKLDPELRHLRLKTSLTLRDILLPGADVTVSGIRSVARSGPRGDSRDQTAFGRALCLASNE
uniref:Uncharacterized protein n=1 Tax=Trichuris muris TaxID=70415 RepID=A0A5S6QL06_TRIMR